MGCDIHLRVEARRDGAWHDVTADAVRPNYDYDAPDDPFSRNYVLFAFLADVRQGDGIRHRPGYLGGIEASRHKIEPLVAHRGLPDDIARDHDVGDHSQTWATLAELRRADWDREVRDAGVIDAQTYETWREKRGCPDGWCKATSNPTMTEASYLAATERPARVSVAVEWTWRPLVNCGFKRWLDGLSASAFGAASDDDVRVLMGFDS